MITVMTCYFWTLLGIGSLTLLSPTSSQQLPPLCQSNTQRFPIENPEPIPPFCTDLQLRFYGIDYRIDFTEAEVDSVCDSRICRAVMTDLTLPCITFPKREINCLDSPGLIHVWCSNSDEYDNTSCFASLRNQGVIDTPNLFTPCLDALYNAESCPDYCRNIFMNADCCFVSYYAFMIDSFVDDDGFPVFEKSNFVGEKFWDWCNVTSPGICPGLSLDNLTDYSPRDDEITCKFEPISINTTLSPTPTMTIVPSTMSSSPAPSDSPGGAIIQEPLIGFTILTVLIVFISTIQ